MSVTKKSQQLYETLCEVETLGGLKKNDTKFWDLERKLNKYLRAMAERKEQAAIGRMVSRDLKDEKMEESFYAEYKVLCEEVSSISKVLDKISFLLETATE